MTPFGVDHVYMLKADHLGLDNLLLSYFCEELILFYLAVIICEWGLLRFSSSTLACQLELSLYRSFRGSDIVEISWMQLLCHI